MAQETGEDKLGNWLMYFGTSKLSDRYSLHTEVQLRLFEPINNFNQLLPRIGINYHITPSAWATLGYAWIPTESYEKGANLKSSTENRIWEQFLLRNKVGRFAFEHRYRLEQRWISSEGTDTYLDRIRYRLMISVPLSNKEMLPGTWFAAVYDELFMNITDNPFDQNRLYLALGYKLSDALSFQSGYLYHRLGSLNYNRLQFAVFWNMNWSRQAGEQ